MLRIKGYKKYGDKEVSNFFRAVRYATIVALEIKEGANTMKPFKRRAKRNEAAIRFLAFLSSLDESVEKEVERRKKLEPSKLEDKLKKLSKKKREEVEKHISSLKNYLKLLFNIQNDEEIEETLVETLIFWKLFKEAIEEGDRKYLVKDLNFAEIFGGYGSFALGAAALGYNALYVELNPVATFFFATYAKGKPEGYLEKAQELVDYLKEEVEKKYFEINGKVPYLTFRARLVKCSFCGEHIPFIKADNKSVGRVTLYSGSSKKKSRTLYIEPFALSDIPEELLDLPPSYLYGFRFSEEKIVYRCPKCLNPINYSNEKRREKHREALEDDYTVYGRKVSELPRNYSVPVAILEKRGSLELKRDIELLKKVRGAMKELYENRDYYQELVAYEEIPESIVVAQNRTAFDKLKNAGIKYRTQLMSPRQLLLYAKLIERIKDLDEELRDYFAMVMTKGLQTNTLISYNFSNQELDKLMTIQNISYPSFPSENPVTNGDRGSIDKLFLGKKNKRSNYNNNYNITKLNSKILDEIVIEDAYKVSTDELDGILVLNEAAQELYSYVDLHEKFDVIFVDPPYVNNIPYRDLSYLFYARLKKIYGERLPYAKYTLDEIRSLDLTKDDPKEFGRLLKESLRSIKDLLKSGGIIFFQFAPPSSTIDVNIDGNKITIEPKAVRRRTFSAIIASGLVPVMLSPIVAEGSGHRGHRGGAGFTIKTMLIELVRVEDFDEFIDENYLKAIRRSVKIYSGNDKEIIEGIKELANTIEFRDYVNKILSSSSKPNLGDSIAIAYAALSPALAYALRGIEDEKTVANIFSKVQEEVSTYILDLLIEKIFGVKGFSELVKYDLSALIAVALYQGYLEIDALKGLGLKIGEKIKKIRSKFFKSERVSGRRGLRIAKLKPLRELPKPALHEYAPTLYYLIYEPEVLRNPNEVQKKILKLLKEGLEEYEKREFSEKLSLSEKEEEEQVTVSNLKSLIDKLLSRFFIFLGGRGRSIAL